MLNEICQTYTRVGKTWQEIIDSYKPTTDDVWYWFSKAGYRQVSRSGYGFCPPGITGPRLYCGSALGHRSVLIGHRRVTRRHVTGSPFPTPGRSVCSPFVVRRATRRFVRLAPLVWSGDGRSRMDRSAPGELSESAPVSANRLCR